MSVIDIRPDVPLTEHDHIVDDERIYPDLHGYYLPWDLSVSLHLRATTPIVVRVHADEHRAVVRFGANSAQTDLFVKADQLDRLIAVLTAARTRLGKHP